MPRTKGPSLGLHRRRRRWYVRVRVPADVRDAYNKKAHIIESTGTADRAEAELIALRLVADIREGFEAVRRGDTKAERQQAETKGRRQRKLDDLLKTLAELRHQADAGELEVHALGNPDDHIVRNHQTGEEGTEDTLNHVRDYLIDQVMNLFPEGDAPKDLSIPILALGDPSIILLRDTITDYLREKATHVTKRTLKTKKRRLEAFQTWLNDDHYLLRDVDRRVAGDYTQTFARLIVDEKLSPKTARDTLADLSSFHNWCMVRGRIDINPFAKQASTIRSSTRGTSDDSRRAWTEDELLAFHNTVPPTSKPWILATLCMYTGARVSEVCGLRVDDIEDGCFMIRAGKTKSAVRNVPIHPVLVPLVEYLRTASSDDYLIPELAKGGPDDTRGEYLQDELRKVIRKKAGIMDERVVPHTLRHGFITALEQGRVPENEILTIIGHKRKSLALSVYSAGVDLERKRENVEAVTLGKPVDNLVSRRIGELLAGASG